MIRTGATPWPTVFCYWPLMAILTLSCLSQSLAQAPAKSREQEPGGDKPATVDPGDLESLLKAADKDVSQLARVNVAAPALQMEVSTVSRHTSTVGRSPAAVFVMTHEMIRRSGARSIPELLRMVPGVEVARIDASKWAISIRGFNGRFANKLLVQIDGRSVYTPLFGGVFWDVQDTLLEDIERIEVIRGPGATIWGANAVNGIINIITKKAKDTQGGYAQGGAGSEEKGFASARYGGQLASDAYYRVYGKWFARDQGYALGNDGQDDWRMARGGFRADWTPNRCDTITLQGDYYDGVTGRRNYFPAFPDPDPVPPAPDFIRVVDDDAPVRGGNVLYRWSRKLSDDSDWSLHFYYDRTERAWPNAAFREDRDTIDFDFQYRFAWNRRNSVIWGFKYRNTRSWISEVPFVLAVHPPKRADDLFSYFVQDQVTVREDLLYLIWGSKFLHNDYTGFEFQPTVRLLWTPSERQSLWTAVSRAVRTPTIAETDFRATLAPPFPGVPLFPQIVSNPDFQSEQLLAFEAGIRMQPTDAFSWDLATFFHNYEDIRSTTPMGFVPGPPALAPLMFDNDNNVQTYGFELAANHQVNRCWKLYGQYTFLVLTGNTGGEVGDPRNELYVQSSWNIRRAWELDTIWRYVDRVPELVVPSPATSFPGVPSYNVVDVRLAWRPRPNLELAVVGRNLLDGSHPEFATDLNLGTVTTEVEREAYGMVTWRH